MLRQVANNYLYQKPRTKNTIWCLVEVASCWLCRISQFNRIYSFAHCQPTPQNELSFKGLLYAHIHLVHSIYISLSCFRARWPYTASRDTNKDAPPHDAARTFPVVVYHLARRVPPVEIIYNCGVSHTHTPRKVLAH